MKQLGTLLWVLERAEPVAQEAIPGEAGLSLREGNGEAMCIGASPFDRGHELRLPERRGLDIVEPQVVKESKSRRRYFKYQQLDVVL